MQLSLRVNGDLSTVIVSLHLFSLTGMYLELEPTRGTRQWAYSARKNGTTAIIQAFETHKGKGFSVIGYTPFAGNFSFDRLSPL